METNQFYGATNGIESLISLGMPYGHLESQIIQIQESEEAEDPPETLHTTWGIWLHKRDPLHNLDQRYDMEHVLRTLRPGDDILHYYHYVPVIGDHEHIHESYGMSFEYDYSNEEMIYNANISTDEETDDAEITPDTEPGEDANLINKENDEEPDAEEKIPMGKEQKNIDFGFNKESLKISEEILKLIKINPA